MTMKTERVQKQNCMCVRGFFLFSLLIALTGFASLTEAWNIPAERSITWRGNVGVDGGIPTRTTIYVTLSPGATASQINSALNSCPSGQVVYLNAGTYNLTSYITIPSNKTLRGAGPNETILKTSGGGQLIKIGGGYTDANSASPRSAITGDSYTKGATNITVESSSGFAVGNWIYVDELNDPSFVVNCDTYGGIFGGNGSRAFAAAHKITNISGNTLTIIPPAIHTFPTSLSPRAIKASPTFTQYAGVEDLQLYLTDKIYDVYMQGAVNCWVKNVWFEKVGKYGVYLDYDCIRNEIRDCYFHDAIDWVNSDSAYAVHLWCAQWNLIENNVWDATCDGTIAAMSTANVIAYNFGVNVGRRTGDSAGNGWPVDWSHQAHSAYNLYEGNYGAGIKFDFIHGSGSHNTYFRNRATSKMGEGVYQPDHDASAITIFYGNYYENIVGNILGLSGWNKAYEYKQASGWGTANPIYGTGIGASQCSLKSNLLNKYDSNCFATLYRHLNYDYYTNSTKHCDDSGEPGCGSANSDTVLPDSLYLSSKPSWYGGCTWPPVDPNVPVVEDIPAKLRYEGSSCSPGDTNRPSPPINLQIKSTINTTSSN
jgi:hypothetical protein